MNMERIRMMIKSLPMLMRSTMRMRRWSHEHGADPHDDQIVANVDEVDNEDEEVVT
jgi:hypothetical protein